MPRPVEWRRHMSQEVPGILLKYAGSDLGGLGWDLECCIFSKLLSDDDAVGYIFSSRT